MIGPAVHHRDPAGKMTPALHYVAYREFNIDCYLTTACVNVDENLVSLV